MKSFGRLLRKMRGTTTLEELARRSTVDVGLLAGWETGLLIPEEPAARKLLMKGFGLDRHEADRAILGIQLYDLGLRDNDIRQLVIDVIEGIAPASVESRLRELYRRYSSQDRGYRSPPPIH